MASQINRKSKLLLATLVGLGATTALEAAPFKWRLYASGVTYESRCLQHHLEADLDAAGPGVTPFMKNKIHNLKDKVLAEAEDLRDALLDRDPEDINDDADDLHDAVDDLEDYLDDVEKVFELSDEADNCKEDLEDLAKYLEDRFDD